MADFKKEKTSELLKHLAANFIKEEAGPHSLITVSRVFWQERAGSAFVYFTAYPEEKEEEALDFLKRKRSDFREYVKKNSKIGRIPFFDFQIDKGEKNRQTIENLSQKS